MSDTMQSRRAGTAPDRRAAAVAERRFFLTMAAVCALALFLGFAPSYYLKPVLQAPPPLSAMTHVHGLVFSAWVVLFVVQAGLIGVEKPMLHRRIGLVGAVLFGIVVATGVMTGLNAARLGHAPPASPPALVFLVVPLSAIVSTAILTTAALWNRARSDAHMRYMLAGLIVVTPPGTHRIAFALGLFEPALWIAFLVSDLLLGLAMLYDLRRRGAIHPAYLWSALVFAAGEGVIAWAYNSPAWLPVAEWLVQT